MQITLVIQIIQIILTTGSEEIQVLSLLGIIIYDKQKFNLHVDRICKSGSIQLNALIRLKKGIFKERL